MDRQISPPFLRATHWLNLVKQVSNPDWNIRSLAIEEAYRIANDNFVQMRRKAFTDSRCVALYKAYQKARWGIPFNQGSDGLDEDLGKVPSHVFYARFIKHAEGICPGYRRSWNRYLWTGGLRKNLEKKDRVPNGEVLLHDARIDLRQWTHLASRRGAL